VAPGAHALAPRASSTPIDLVLLLALSALWGASYSFIRVAVATIPPLTLIAARTLIAGTLLAGWIGVRNIEVPFHPALTRRFLLQALLNSVVPYALLAWAEQSVEAGLATILNSASPVLAFVATWMVTRHERVTARKLFGVVAGMAGICLVIGPSVFGGLGHQLLPQLAIVAATLCYAGAAIYGRSFRGLSPAVPAAGSMVLGAALLIPVSLVVDHPWTVHPSLRSLAALLALSVFSTAVAFVIYFRLIQTLGSVATTAQAYLRVPIGVGLSVMFLGEALAPTAWAGLACIVAGVAAMTLPERWTNSRGAGPGTSIRTPRTVAMTLSANSALLLIDVQQGFDDPRWGERNNPGAERNIAALLAAWRRSRRPVLHAQHMSREPESPLRPERPGNAFKPEVAPELGEPVFQKTVNSAFIGTALEEHLRARRIDTLVLVGITTDHCVSTTARMAANLGFTTIVVSDGTATFERTGPEGEHYSAEAMHRVALASLHGEFATVRRTGEVLADLGQASIL
jgi:drug/metabolite transporter (DMT)-like permease/nicotinamidase-related amidase